MAKLKVAGVTLFHLLAFGAGCILDLPTFRDHRDDGIDRIPDLSQAIIPAYQFMCTGRVVQWGACFHRGRDTDRYYIRFQVWRQVSPGYYQLVGHNSPEAFTATDLLRPEDHCNLTSVPYEEQVIVQPGDVVGFYSDHWRVERSRLTDNMKNSSIQIATASEYVGITVYYKSGLSLSDLSTSSAVGTTSGDCAVSNSCLQLQSVIQGAPIMTAVVEPIPTPAVVEDNLTKNSQRIATTLTSPNTSYSCCTSSDTAQDRVTVVSSPTGSHDNKTLPSGTSRRLISTLMSPISRYTSSHTVQETITVTSNPGGSQENTTFPLGMSQQNPPIALIVGVPLLVLVLAFILVSLVVVTGVRKAHKRERRERMFMRPRTGSLDYNDVYHSTTHECSSKDCIIMTRNCAYESKDLLNSCPKQSKSIP